MFSRARYLLAAIAAILISLDADPARADCSDAGGAEGLERCPNRRAPAAKRRPMPEIVPVLAGAEPGRPAPPPKSISRRHCENMTRWLTDRRSALAAYQDDELLGTALGNAWRPAEYNDMLWHAIHPEARRSPKGAAALMWTDPRDCKIQNEARGCRLLVALGLPPIACEIARAHELVHVSQCVTAKANPTFDPAELTDYRDREVEAYRSSIWAIQRWTAENCL